MYIELFNDENSCLSSIEVIKGFNIPIDGNIVAEFS